jgi:hypothetical protein
MSVSLGLLIAALWVLLNPNPRSIAFYSRTSPIPAVVVLVSLSALALGGSVLAALP